MASVLDGLDFGLKEVFGGCFLPNVISSLRSKQFYLFNGFTTRQDLEALPTATPFVREQKRKG